MRFERPPLFGRIDSTHRSRYYMYSLVVLVLTFLATRGIRRSRTGRVIIAVRENERAAQSFSIPAVRAKLTAFVDLGRARRHRRRAVRAPQPIVQRQPATAPARASACSPRRSSAGSARSAAPCSARCTCAALGGSSPSQEWQLLSTGGGVLLVLLILPGGLGGLWVTLRDVRRPAAGAADASDSTRRRRRRRRRDASCLASDAGRDGVVMRDVRSLPSVTRDDGCATSAEARPRSRWSCCSASTRSTSSIAPRSASCCRTSATSSTSTTRRCSASSRSVSVAALALQVPIAQFADRSRRVPLAIAGALVWALFSGLTGLATGVIMLTIARSGSAIGKAVIDPTHNSLIADYYPIESRSRVFSTHRAANAVGAFVGPLSRRAARVRVRLARAVPRLRHPDGGLRGPRAATARAGPRALGAPGRWAPATR